MHQTRVMYLYLVLFVKSFFSFWSIPTMCSCFSSSSFSVPLKLPGHTLAFSSMYIFRSRVIKLAPAGMCWNRMSLILPCPHRATKTQICIHIFEHACTNKCSILCFSAIFAFTYCEKPCHVLDLLVYLLFARHKQSETVHHLPATKYIFNYTYQKLKLFWFFGKKKYLEDVFEFFSFIFLKKRPATDCQPDQRHQNLVLDRTSQKK